VLLVLSTASAPVIAIASIGAFVAGGAIGGTLGSAAGKGLGDTVYDIYEWIVE
jgi:outer membrane lipoprotein SlyB